MKIWFLDVTDVCVNIFYEQHSVYITCEPVDLFLHMETRYGITMYNEIEQPFINILINIITGV